MSDRRKAVDTTTQDISTVLKAAKVIAKYKEFIAICVLIIASSGVNLRSNLLSDEKTETQQQKANDLHRAQAEFLQEQEGHLSELHALGEKIDSLESELNKMTNENKILILKLKNMEMTLERIDRRGEAGIWGMLSNKKKQ